MKRKHRAPDEADHRREMEEIRRRSTAENKERLSAAWHRPQDNARSKKAKRTKKRMISQTKYKELIKKRQHHKKLSLTERKQLDRTLFVKYCSCVKSLKYDKKVKDYLEYPVCMSSIYKKRGFKPPKGVTKRCGSLKK